MMTLLVHKISQSRSLEFFVLDLPDSSHDSCLLLHKNLLKLGLGDRIAVDDNMGRPLSSTAMEFQDSRLHLRLDVEGSLVSNGLCTVRASVIHTLHINISHYGSNGEGGILPFLAFLSAGVGDINAQNQGGLLRVRKPFPAVKSSNENKETRN